MLREKKVASKSVIAETIKWEKIDHRDRECLGKGKVSEVSVFWKMQCELRLWCAAWGQCPCYAKKYPA